MPSEAKPARDGTPAEREGVAWSAVMDGRPVVFSVSLEALERLMLCERLSAAECLAAYDLHRPTLERAAVAVYAREPGRVDEIYRITAADVERWGLDPNTK